MIKDFVPYAWADALLYYMKANYVIPLKSIKAYEEYIKNKKCGLLMKGIRKLWGEK